MSPFCARSCFVLIVALGSALLPAALHAQPNAGVNPAVLHDVSPPLGSIEQENERPANAREEVRPNALAPQPTSGDGATRPSRGAPAAASTVTGVPRGSSEIEQTTEGSRPAARLVESFDGLGEGFVGPQGTARFRNPSDNSL